MIETNLSVGGKTLLLPPFFPIIVFMSHIYSAVDIATIKSSGDQSQPYSYPLMVLVESLIRGPRKCTGKYECYGCITGSIAVKVTCTG